MRKKREESHTNHLSHGRQIQYQCLVNYICLSLTGKVFVKSRGKSISYLQHYNLNWLFHEMLH